MTEKEKIISGMIYDANNDPDLIAERLECKQMCHEYNMLSPKDLPARTEKIKEILGEIGSDFLIEQPFMCDYGFNIHIGENFYSNHNLIILDAAPVTFGDNVFIAPNCGFYTAGHPLDATERNKGLEYAHPISVGDNVWIGGNVCVLSGVTIGNNSVIGAGSVVVKDIPPYSLAVGNPCKVIKTVS